MPRRLYPGDPLSPAKRDEYERDLIAFSDRELDLLGDIRGDEVLYAGGTSPLWIEGLAHKIGPSGSITVLDRDAEGLEVARESFGPKDLPIEPEFVVGDVFYPSFGRGSFDLVYSSGLLHELDVRGRPATDALRAMASVLRLDGRLATSDFVDDIDAVQLEEEDIEAEAEGITSGARLYGIGPSGRLTGLHEEVLSNVLARRLPPFEIRHLDVLTLASEPPDESLRVRWNRLQKRVERDGYTRPATLFVEGNVGDTGHDSHEKSLI